MYQLSNIKITPLAFCKKDSNGMYIREVFFDAPQCGPIVRNDAIAVTEAGEGDHVAYSQLPYLSPAPKGTVAELDSFQESRVKDRALLRDVVNVIPQVTESHEQEGLAKQIALAHRRYVLAAGAEFKKLVVKDEPPKQTSAPHYITPQTAVVPKPCVNRGRRLATEQRSSPRVNRDQNAIAPASDIKSRRRMAILDSGALAHELNAMLSYRAASEVWV